MLLSMLPMVAMSPPGLREQVLRLADDATLAGLRAGTATWWRGAGQSRSTGSGFPKPIASPRRVYGGPGADHGGVRRRRGRRAGSAPAPSSSWTRCNPQGLGEAGQGAGATIRQAAATQAPLSGPTRTGQSVTPLPVEFRGNSGGW